MPALSPFGVKWAQAWFKFSALLSWQAHVAISCLSPLVRSLLLFPLHAQPGERPEVILKGKDSQGLPEFLKVKPVGRQIRQGPGMKNKCVCL